MAILKPDLGKVGSRLRAGFAHRRRVAGELTRVVEELLCEVRRANLIQAHRLSMDLMDRSIDDPALADARSTLEGVSQHRRRQLIFANKEYATLLLFHRIDEIDWDELLGHLRVLCLNDVFAEYWTRTAEHRRSLPADSLERRAGEVVDSVFEELADDPDEWWVVGSVQEASSDGQSPSG
ncbi:hypothetical protein G3I40_01965 [Streptomyces sp. SID14478]|uniref:DUF6082 family protein n=1 Tax=Streptomyces sp. SID14478 TaxID=2706073 RepID=UPI0013DB5BD7|nr:DUF6082 family protein [Streptomyces sp. SID14478]NEB74014.1 hypothetical protein [Streptomyces sp. SID14478]